MALNGEMQIKAFKKIILYNNKAHALKTFCIM